MTKHSYPFGWGAGSQVRGRAESPSDYVWEVNFNNGNSNRNNRNNNGFVRAVRGGECQAVTFRQLHAAWREARRGKKPSHNQLAFESSWIDRLLELQTAINASEWHPLPPTCFVAARPKAREIHAPDFSDRVVHHWLVPQLEAIYEPAFIFDSFSNRVGKGTHAAVVRLRSFVRQVASGQGGGFYLQLDIHNFFNSIHRPTLLSLLRERIAKRGLSPQVLHVCEALLRHSPLHYGAHYACSAAERATIPPHKQLINAAPDCGIAIGNLSSQFFANVYLDVLDQFVKHTLKAERYIRYVDDFDLVHPDPAQLLEWRERIIAFLADRLHLSLKELSVPKPISSGIDFLGYIIRPSHVLVRRRVISHATEALENWQRRHVRGQFIRATPEQYRSIVSVLRSYEGHFSHAATHRLRARIARRFPWSTTASVVRSFSPELEGRYLSIPFEAAA